MNVLELMLQDGALKLEKDQPTLDFLLSQYDGSGGFRGRDGKVDLASTAYALRCLRILFSIQEAGIRDIGDYILECRKQDGGFSSSPGSSVSTLENTYFAVTSLNCIGREFDFEPTIQFILGLLEGDGAFAESRSSRKTRIYDSFHGVFSLAALAHEFLDIEKEAVLSHISKQQNTDSGYRRSGHSKLSSLASTAAALLVRYYFEPAADHGELDIYIDSLQSGGGGFLSFGGSVNPDISSTFHGLVCLRILGIPVEASHLDFINSLKSEKGGYSESGADEGPTLESTFYGLASLCLL